MQFRTKLLALAISSALAPNALATNGTFTHGVGTKNKAMAGSGVALPQDSLSAGINPASMVHVGDRMDFGFSLFSPIREYEVRGATPEQIFGAFGQAVAAGQANPNNPPFALETGTFESDNELFMIPSFGRNWMLSDNSSFGVSVYANGGMNTRYDSSQYSFAPINPATGQPAGIPSTYYAGTASINLMQLFVTPTYAVKLGDSFSLGVSPIFAYQQLNISGLASFGQFAADGNPDSLSDRGHARSLGAGAKIGALADLGNFSIGLSAQSKIYMSEFDEYADLLPEQGDFDAPATATIGFAFKPSNTMAATFDIQHIWFSDVAAFGNPFSNLISPTGCAGGVVSKCLGGDNGPGFGWEDVTIYKVGLQYQSSPDWTWRAGYSHGDQPIQSSELLFNIVAPATIQDQITLGLTKKLDKDSEVNIAMMYALEESVTGSNPLSPSPLPTQDIEVSMKQVEFEVSWSWLF